MKHRGSQSRCFFSIPVGDIMSSQGMSQVQILLDSTKLELLYKNSYGCVFLLKLFLL